jgi:hypothetical protein
MNNSLKTKPKGYEQLTVPVGAVGLASIPAGASRAIVMVEGQPLRYREDGVNPTSLIGVLCVATTRFELESRKAIEGFRAIRSGGTDSVVSVLYYN